MELDTQPSVDNEIINADNLNKHFCEVGPKLRDSTTVYCDISFTDFLSDRNDQCQISSFNTVSSEKIHDNIK